MLKTEQYHELDEDIIEFFKAIERDFAFAIDIKYAFQANTKQKKLITLKKIPDNYAVLLNSEIIVTINEEYFSQLDDDGIKRILFEQEIDKVVPNMEKGTFKISQPFFKTSIPLIRKHTYENVERASEAERLLIEQKEDNS
jgi:hypothetical protein